MKWSNNIKKLRKWKRKNPNSLFIIKQQKIFKLSKKMPDKNENIIAWKPLWSPNSSNIKIVSADINETGK